MSFPSTPSQEEVDREQLLLESYRRTLAHLLTQQAQFSAGYIPTHIANGIAEARADLQRSKEILRGWGVMVPDKPNDAPLLISGVSGRRRTKLSVIIIAMIGFLIALITFMRNQLPPSPGAEQSGIPSSQYTFFNQELKATDFIKKQDANIIPDNGQLKLIGKHINGGPKSRVWLDKPLPQNVRVTITLRVLKGGRFNIGFAKKEEVTGYFLMAERRKLSVVKLVEAEVKEWIEEIDDVNRRVEENVQITIVLERRGGESDTDLLTMRMGKGEEPILLLDDFGVISGSGYDFLTMAVLGDSPNEPDGEAIIEQLTIE
jgi:hypothetical protein